MARHAVACRVALMVKVLQHCIRSVAGLETVRESVFWPSPAWQPGFYDFPGLCQAGDGEFTNFQTVAMLETALQVASALVHFVMACNKSATVFCPA
jgi:hypothetical protein